MIVALLAIVLGIGLCWLAGEVRNAPLLDEETDPELRPHVVELGALLAELGIDHAREDA